MQQFYQPLDPDVHVIDEREISAYVAKVYAWMFAGLLITALTTVGIVMGINASEAFMELINTAFNMVILVFVAQLALVFVISRRVMKMNPTTAKALYIIYAMTNGLTVGLVAVLVSIQVGGGLYVLGMAFGITAVSFGAMALYGYFTGADLTRFSSLLRMGLFGLILAMVVNWFMGSDMIDFLICIVGLFIFLGLVAADTNKIKNHFARVALGSTDEDNAAMGIQLDRSSLASNLAIVGALMLYLDFINIFMFVLRLLARRR